MKNKTRITVRHPNGYTGVLYGESSFAIMDKDGKEVMHTGFRNINTADEVYETLDNYPDFREKFMSILEEDDEEVNV